MRYPNFRDLPDILAGDLHGRPGVISFYVDGIDYNLIIQILDDRILWAFIRSLVSTLWFNQRSLSVCERET